MPKWEYKLVDITGKHDWNAIGREGWELVTVLYKRPGWFVNGGGIAFFKRPLISKDPVR